MVNHPNWTQDSVQHDNKEDALSFVGKTLTFDANQIPGSAVNTTGLQAIQSINSDNNPLQTFLGTDGLDAATADGETQIGLATEANNPYFIFPPNPFNGTGVTLTANTVYVLRIRHARRLSLSNAYVWCVTANAGALASIGIYSNSGDKEVASGTFNFAATGLKSAALNPNPYTWAPNSYYLAWTINNAVAAFAGLAGLTATAYWSLILNQNIVHIGTAANASVAGVLPATLGAITPLETIPYPIFKLE